MMGEHLDLTIREAGVHPGRTCSAKGSRPFRKRFHYLRADVPHRNGAARILRSARMLTFSSGSHP
jgi:hypothetical protein